MTLNYFAPDRRYSSTRPPGGPTREFKAMVKAFHDAGHQGLHRRGLQPHRRRRRLERHRQDHVYNLLSRGAASTTRPTTRSPATCSTPWDNTGVGGNYNTRNPVAQNLIVDSLAYWRDTLGVDGFRFDLASVLGNTCQHGCFNFDKMDAGNALNRIVAELPPRPAGGGTRRRPDRRAVGDRRQLLPGRQLPDRLGGVERHLPRHHAQGPEQAGRRGGHPGHAGRRASPARRTCTATTAASPGTRSTSWSRTTASR